MIQLLPYFAGFVTLLFGAAFVIALRKMGNVK